MQRHSGGSWLVFLGDAQEPGVAKAQLIDVGEKQERSSLGQVG